MIKSEGDAKELIVPDDPKTGVHLVLNFLTQDHRPKITLTKLHPSWVKCSRKIQKKQRALRTQLSPAVTKSPISSKSETERRVKGVNKVDTVIEKS